MGLGPFKNGRRKFKSPLFKNDVFLCILLHIFFSFCAIYLIFCQFEDNCKEFICCNENSKESVYLILYDFFILNFILCQCLKYIKKKQKKKMKLQGMLSTRIVNQTLVFHILHSLLICDSFVFFYDFLNIVKN